MKINIHLVIIKHTVVSLQDHTFSLFLTYLFRRLSLSASLLLILVVKKSKNTVQISKQEK